MDVSRNYLFELFVLSRKQVNIIARPLRKFQNALP